MSKYFDKSKTFEYLGVVLASGSLEFREPGTSTPKTVYSDSDLTVSLGSTVSLNASGQPGTEIYGSGLADVLVKNASGTTLLTITDVGTSIDAASVTYTPGGTGAVATTVQAALRRIVHIDDFNATGNGTADDYTALANALTAADGGILILNGVVYGSSTEILLENLCPNGVEIVGNGAEIKALSSMRAVVAPTDTFSTTLERVNIQDLSLNANSLAAYCLRGVVSYSDIKNIQMSGSTDYGCNSGFSKSTISNVFIDHPAAANNNAWDCGVDDSTVNNLVVNTNGTTNQISAVWNNGSRNATYNGIYVYGGGVGAIGAENCQDITYINPRVKGDYTATTAALTFGVGSVGGSSTGNGTTTLTINYTNPHDRQLGDYVEITAADDAARVGMWPIASIVDEDTVTVTLDSAATVGATTNETIALPCQDINIIKPNIRPGTASCVNFNDVRRATIQGGLLYSAASHAIEIRGSSTTGSMIGTTVEGGATADKINFNSYNRGFLVQDCPGLADLCNSTDVTLVNGNNALDVSDANTVILTGASGSLVNQIDVYNLLGSGSTALRVSCKVTLYFADGNCTINDKSTSSGNINMPGNADRAMQLGDIATLELIGREWYLTSYVDTNQAFGTGAQP